MSLKIFMRIRYILVKKGIAMSNVSDRIIAIKLLIKLNSVV